MTSEHFISRWRSEKSAAYLCGAVAAAEPSAAGKSALAGGARMLLIGALAGGATYFIGSLFGVAAG